MYELTFTKDFQNGLMVLPKEIFPIVDRCLRRLEADPFQQQQNAKRMKNVANAFRMRIGIHIRMLYHVFSKERRVVLELIASREKVFEKRLRENPIVISAAEAEAIRREIGGFTRRSIAPTLKESTLNAAEDHVQPFATTDNQAALPVSVEPVEWVSEEELFLLRIREAVWPQIIDAGSMANLQKVGLSSDDLFKLEDYLTSPTSHHIGKLYCLAAGQGANSIANAPLSEFLLALDPEQRRVVDFPIDGGPYLVKGGPGTGKSLIGLYRIRQLVAARAAESLFDSHTPTYGVITYTNTLVDASRKLLDSLLTDKLAGCKSECTTLDKVARKLAALSLGMEPSALDGQGVENWLRDTVLPEMASPEVQALADKFGVTYIGNEIDQVIQGNGINSIDDYLQHPRRGRKTPLNRRERTLLWQVYEQFVQLCRKRKVQTFSEWRLMALNYLRANPSYQRYDGLFVDEVQDLSRVGRLLCLELVRDHRFLLFAADTGQSIYAVPPTWAETDSRLNLKGRTVILKRNFRSTLQTAKAIAPLRDELDDGEDRGEQGAAIFEGDKPLWRVAPVASHQSLTADIVAGYVFEKKPPIHPGQLAIIVRDKAQAAGHERALRDRGIEAHVVDKGSPIDLKAAHVHILTAHSAKGLEFPYVIVPSVSGASYPLAVAMKHSMDESQRAEALEMEQRLLYVALSRANFRLHMLVDADNPSPFVQQLKTADWEYID